MVYIRKREQSPQRRTWACLESDELLVKVDQETGPNQVMRKFGVEGFVLDCGAEPYPTEIAID